MTDKCTWTENKYDFADAGCVSGGSVETSYARPDSRSCPEWHFCPYCGKPLDFVPYKESGDTPCKS